MIANAPSPTVFVDLAPLHPDGSNGGAAAFVLTLLERLAPALPLRLLVKPAVESAVARVTAAGAAVHLLGEEIAEPRRLSRTLRRLPLGGTLPDPASLRRRGAAVLFSPLQTASFHEPGLRHVAIAYDFQELAFPSNFSAPERRRRAAFRADLRRCEAVAAISEFTRSEAVARVGIAPGRLLVLPPVVAPPARLPESEAAALLAGHDLAAGSYVLYPANFWPHKNHERLLQALALGRGARLVCCGALGEGRVRAAERATELGVAGRVSFLPYVAPRELTALLQSARGLIFPSLFEGFGIPLFEAFALGTPVACSRIPALAELAGDAALLFDPDDPAAIAGALETLVSDAAVRDRLAASGRSRAAAFDTAALLSRWTALLTP